MSNAAIFLILLPSCAVYAGAFWKLEKPTSEPLYERLQTLEMTDAPASLAVAPPGGETQGQRVKRCVRVVAFLASNLALVYIAEYVASVMGASYANGAHPEDSPEWVVRNSYELLAFCYQAGACEGGTLTRRTPGVLELRAFLFGGCRCPNIALLAAVCAHSACGSSDGAADNQPGALLYSCSASS